MKLYWVFKVIYVNSWNKKTYELKDEEIKDLVFLLDLIL